MKLISIYELLGLIKDGKAPKKIKVTGRIYEYDETYDFYYTKSNKANYNVSLGGMEDEINLIANAFYENVEIIESIEDEFIDIKELYDNSTEFNFSDRQTGMTKEDRRLLDSNFKELGNKINDLIKNQKKIIERLKDGK